MPLPSSQTLPSILSLSSSEPSAAGFEDRQGREHHNTTSFGQLSAAGLSPITSTAVSTNHSVVQRSSPKPPLRTLFGNQEKTLFMQVFVEEVGLWMDSLDSSKHVRVAFPLEFFATFFSHTFSFPGFYPLLHLKSLCCSVHF